MAQKSVAQFKDSVAGLLLGTSLNNVTGLDKAIERAARVLVQLADVPEASGRQNYMLYDNVFNYPAPDTIFGGALNDLRPQGVSRNEQDVVYKKPVELFDRIKHNLPNGYMVTFEYDKGVPIMRVAQTRAKASIEISGMGDASDWTAGGSLSGLATDETVYYESPAALRFALTGSSTGTLTQTLDNELDLSDYEDVGVAFLAIRIPDGATASNLTSISLKLGSSDAAYDLVTDTEGFLGAWVSGEYLLVALDFSTATSTGTPDWSALDYVQVSFVHTGTFTNFRVGGLFIALPSPHELLFQSAAVFNEDGTLSNVITDGETLIILRDAAYTLFENFAALEIAESTGSAKMSGKVETLKDKIFNKETGLLPMYRGDNPSEELRTVGSYY